MSTTALTFWTELLKPDEGTETDDWAPEVTAIWDAWDRALGGQVSLTVTSGDVTLSTTEAQHGRIFAAGSPASAKNLIFPSRNRLYQVVNSTTQDLFCYVTGHSDKKVHVPPSAMLSFTISTDGFSRPIAPPVVAATGSFPSTILHPGKSYSAGGMFFGSDVEMGFARRAAGQMGVSLLNSEGRDTLRFTAPGSASVPTIAMGASFNDGFYPSSGVAWASAGTFRGRFGQGIEVGAPAGGDKGTGTINAAGTYYRNNLALPFQQFFYWTGRPVDAGSGASTAHGLPGAGYTFKFARCTVANNGYAVGDLIDIGSHQMLVGSGATQVFYRIGASGLSQFQKATTTAFGLTTAQWNLEIGVFF